VYRFHVPRFTHISPVLGSLLRETRYDETNVLMRLRATELQIACIGCDTSLCPHVTSPEALKFVIGEFTKMYRHILSLVKIGQK
jgi:hypothetical protein